MFSCNRFFELALTRSGYELVTDPIPFDAVALGSDELPAVSTTDSLVTCENDAGNNDDECPDSRLENSGSLQMKVLTETTRFENAWQKKQKVGIFPKLSSPAAVEHSGPMEVCGNAEELQHARTGSFL